MKYDANTYFWFWDCRKISPVTLWLIDSEWFLLSNFMLDESPFIQFFIHSVFIETIMISGENLNRVS